MAVLEADWRDSFLWWWWWPVMVLGLRDSVELEEERRLQGLTWGEGLGEEGENSSNK